MLTTSPTFSPLTVDGLDEVHRLADTLLGVLPGVGIVVVDSQMRIQLIEGRPHGRHGMDSEGVVGRSISDVLPARAWGAVKAKWPLRPCAAKPSRSTGLRSTGWRTTCSISLRSGRLRERLPERR